MKRFLIALSLLAAAPGFAQSAPAGGKLCAVSVQDRTNRAVSLTGLDGGIHSHLRARGIDVAGVDFGPSADVDHSARKVGCDTILYLELTSFERTFSRRSIAVEFSYRVWSMESHRILLAGSPNWKMPIRGGEVDSRPLHLGLGFLARRAADENHDWDAAAKKLAAVLVNARSRRGSAEE